MDHIFDFNNRYSERGKSNNRTGTEQTNVFVPTDQYRFNITDLVDILEDRESYRSAWAANIASRRSIMYDFLKTDLELRELKVILIDTDDRLFNVEGEDEQGILLNLFFEISNTRLDKRRLLAHLLLELLDDTAVPTPTQSQINQASEW